MKPKPAAIGGMPGGHTSNLMQLYLCGYDASALRDEGDRAFIMYIYIYIKYTFAKRKLPAS